MSVKVQDVIERLNNLAPEYLAQQWDNVGLQVGSANSKVSKILLALDATSNVIEEAIAIEADMIVTHHPMVFSPIKSIIKDNSSGKKIYNLIKNDISLYVMHTNFDTAFGGTNDVLGDLLGLSNVEVINPDERGVGIGRIGQIDKTTIQQLSAVLKKELGISHARVVGDLNKEVEKVAICTGSGMGFMESALGKADVFITGDVKFHEAQEARELGMAVIDVGHYNSENIAMPSIKAYMEEFSKTYGVTIEVSKINEDPFTTI